ncbi:MAG TPA: hypothetical protein VLT32_02800 [Candidatus Sulfomarinibacteraceae bacterium]|nr:hypothetical protein [Candidatus Sulfomarinibacteraceae bacterium]
MTRRRPVLTIAAGALAVSATVLAQAPCAPLPPPAGPTVEAWPTDADTLRSLVAGAATGTTILLHDGFYDLSGGDSLHRLVFSTPGLTLRSASGVREAVVLDGGYVTGELVSIQASDTTIADLTLQRAYYHPIHASGPDVPISGVLIHNVRVVDPGEQAIKVNPIGAGTVDFSTLQCSHLELTGAGRPHIRNDCYTGGLDVHAATGWLVRRNRVVGFWCDAGLSEHGIHMWRQCVDSVVEENLVLDCARGIGFGLGDGVDGHTGGVIRNNFVAAADPDLFASQFGFDTGIALWGADDAVAVHNTVASTQAPFSSMEWRFITTPVTLANNLVTHQILDRGGPASLAGNLEQVSTALFADLAAGDLHLVDPASAPVGAAVPLAAGVCDHDFDGQLRDAAPDVGADELGRPLFGDDFESGGTASWTVTVP